MPKKGKRHSARRKKAQARSLQRYLWWGIGLSAVLFAAIAFWVTRGRTIPFELTGGESNPLVLLDGETTVYYDFTYTGSAPVVLERIIPRIQVYSDQVPVADVTGGLVVTDSGEIELEEGYLPVGESLTLQPGDTFQAGFTYLGKEIGWNKILGFRLQYSLEGRLNDVELELTEKYYVFVE